MATPIIQKQTWDEWYTIAIRNNFASAQRLRQEVKILAEKGGRGSPLQNLECFSAVVQGSRPVLLLRGVAIQSGVCKPGSPEVVVCITITDQFPNTFPIITLEPPPTESGWALRPNMRNVGADGTCFLATVNGWQPGKTMLREVADELTNVVIGDFPFQQNFAPQQAPQPVHPSGGQSGPPPPGSMPPQQQPPQQHPPYQHQQQPQQPPQQQQQPAYYQQQQPPPAGSGGVYNPAPQRRSPPPSQQSGSVDLAWTTLTGVVFELGEAELSRNGGQGFHTQADQWRCIDRWCHKAVQVMVNRRVGDPDGIELVTGSVMKEEHVRSNPALLNVYHLIIQAQVGGGQEAEIQRVVVAFLGLPGFREKMQESATLLATMYCPGAEAPPQPQGARGGGGPVSMDTIWTSFFASLFTLAEGALQRGELTRADVTDQEPWLYIGLTSATALETILRSPPTGPMVLALGGKTVTPDMVPPEGAELFAAFLQLRDAMASSNISPEEMVILKRKSLWADRDDRHVDVPPKLTRIVGGLNSIATRASQHGAFKANFQNTLELLAAVA